MFPPLSDRFPPCGEYMLLEGVLYGLNHCCVLFFIVLSYNDKKVGTKHKKV